MLSKTHLRIIDNSIISGKNKEDWKMGSSVECLKPGLDWEQDWKLGSSVGRWSQNPDQIILKIGDTHRDARNYPKTRNQWRTQDFFKGGLSQKRGPFSTCMQAHAQCYHYITNSKERAIVQCPRPSLTSKSHCREYHRKRESSAGCLNLASDIETPKKLEYSVDDKNLEPDRDPHVRIHNKKGRKESYSS